MKETNMSNPVESFRYIKCYSSSSPRPITILTNITVRRSTSDREELKLHWKSEKRPHFSRWTTSLLTNWKKVGYYQQVKFLKDFTNHRKKTNRAIVFSRTPFPSILKYRDHRWDFPAIWKTGFLQIHIEEFR